MELLHKGLEFYYNAFPQMAQEWALYKQNHALELLQGL